MITALYNIAQLFLLAAFWPVLLALVLLKPKYRKRIPARLGLGLGEKLDRAGIATAGEPTIWVHALSVGEVTSAVPLIKKLRQTWPDSRIILTVTTTTGEAIALDKLAETADVILPSPIDLLPVVTMYAKQIRPDIYIQVETDFWPNILSLLRRKNVPTLLVNGRISQKSLGSYKKFSFFFSPMFRSFEYLSMQTRADAENMKSFGVPGSRLLTLGNLKFDIPAEKKGTPEIGAIIPENRLIFVAGSTHDGEEEIVFASFRDLIIKHPELYLVLVPRNPGRAAHIQHLATRFGLDSALRSTLTSNPNPEEDMLIVDTIGELVEFYRHSSIAFVGGSLVAQGGHNPIEPAIMGVPVLYGPHMEDFQEIAEDLIVSGGAHQVKNSDQLTHRVSSYISDPDERQQAGNSARDCIISQQGVLDRHIELIATLI